ncbi:TPA: MFS transporter [Candidatus Gastranaerophilales bacterium HUM_8]|nr:MAG TPA: MFS transporter [Candidatus Gastranaerophilales bacterium HUM_8]DAB00167.1 MAG TPA: MFS transporter [Candidatus Gastranaerophilales bacterium HUM_11]DAB13023.1 MAG TPA: MFS transporter [Candidatus Gastranaerophilales bacterium HUM_16]
MRKSTCLLPLALGTFGLGLTEFVMMGILPDTALAMKVSIPQAGSFISMYALGVVAGAVLLVVIARTKPLKTILLWLMSIFTIANLATAFVGNYHLFCAIRFIAGLPHGAFFGVGAISAGRLCEHGRENQAVATMVAGMTVANLLGIPFGTFISHNLSWRLTFLLIGLFGFVIVYSIIKLIPYLKPLPDNGFRGQFNFLKSIGPWLLIIAVIMGNGGIFCWYSYINPLLVKVSGIMPKYVSIVMVLAGAGMCIGNFLGGKLSDKFSPALVAGMTQLTACIALLLIFFFASNPIASIILMCVCTGCLFAVSAPQQVLLIENARGGEMLGASFSQISFNLGNAIGAFVGALPVKYGLGYQYTAIPGAFFAFIGFVMLFYFYRKYQYTTIH